METASSKNNMKARQYDGNKSKNAPKNEPIIFLTNSPNDPRRLGIGVALMPLNRRPQRPFHVHVVNHAARPALAILASPAANVAAPAAISIGSGDIDAMEGRMRRVVVTLVMWRRWTGVFVVEGVGHGVGSRVGCRQMPDGAVVDEPLSMLCS